MSLHEMYRRPVEKYEADDAPELPLFDPVARVFRLVFIFACLQAVNILLTIAVWLR